MSAFNSELVDESRRKKLQRIVDSFLPQPKPEKATAAVVVDDVQSLDVLKARTEAAKQRRRERWRG